MTKPEKAKKKQEKERTAVGIGKKNFLFCLFSLRFFSSLTHPENDQLSSVVFYSFFFFSSSGFFFSSYFYRQNFIFLLATYSSSSSSSSSFSLVLLKNRHQLSLWTSLQVAQGYSMCAIRVDSFAYTYARSCVRTHAHCL